MKTLAKTLGAAALAAVLVACLAYAAGTLDLARTKTVLLGATLVWFGAATYAEQRDPTAP